MNELLPRVLFLAKRGLCPSCGTPLELGADAPEVACRFCGEKAVLQRRLRKVEPEVEGAPPRLFLDAEAAEAGRGASPTAAPWVRAEGYRHGVVERTLCPGCGDLLPLRDDEEAVRCPSCGTDCRMERRLWVPPPDPAAAVPRPRREEERRGEHPEDADPETEQLVYRIVTATDLATRVALALRFEEWLFVNATAARLLPSLLAVMKGAPPELQMPIADLVGKLLCEGSPALRNATIRAVEPFLFEPPVPAPLLAAVGLGDGVCLKLLLDASELAHRRGDDDLATANLLAVDWIFQRNFPQHAVMGEILLYRMLYLSGPPLAFALLLARRRITGTGFHYSAETLLGFIDEAAVERPALVPELDRCFYVGLPADEKACRARMTLFAALRTDAAREAALREYLMPPEEAPEELSRELAGLLLPLAREPALEAASRVALRRLVELPREVPAVVHELVGFRGDALPAELRRAYLRRVPGTPHLSEKALPSWEPDPEPKLAPEMERLLAV